MNKNMDLKKNFEKVNNRFLINKMKLLTKNPTEQRDPDLHLLSQFQYLFVLVLFYDSVIPFIVTL